MIPKTIRRFISLLKRLSQISDYNVITYSGKLFSLNDLYSSGHWRTRQNIKNKYKEIFMKVLDDHNVKPVENFSILIFYNSRHDPDNITGMEKILVDTMRSTGIIIDDTKKYYKFFGIVPDLQLKKNSLEIYLIDHGN